MSKEWLTQSRYRTLMTCERQHFYRYELCRRPRPTLAQAFGTCWHLFQRLWWRWNPTLPPLPAIDPDDLDWEKHRSPAREQTIREFFVDLRRLLTESAPKEVDAYEIARLTAMARGYQEMWDGTASPLFPDNGDAQRFTAPLVWNDVEHDFVVLAGELDNAVTLQGGIPAVLEHKSTASAGADYWEYLLIDPQISQYLVGATHVRAMPVFDVVYDVAVKPKHKPRAGETPRAFEDRLLEEVIRPDLGRFYQRQTIARSVDDIERHLADCWAAAERLRELSNEIDENAHRRNTGACRQYGQLCEYLPVCTGRAGIDDDTLYTTSTKHPELGH